MVSGFYIELQYTAEWSLVKTQKQIKFQLIYRVSNILDVIQ